MTVHWSLAMLLWDETGAELSGRELERGRQTLPLHPF